jgi:hypothetical protein
VSPAEVTERHDDRPLIRQTLPCMYADIHVCVCICDHDSVITKCRLKTLFFLLFFLFRLRTLRRKRNTYHTLNLVVALGKDEASADRVSLAQCACFASADQILAFVLLALGCSLNGGETSRASFEGVGRLHRTDAA